MTKLKKQIMIVEDEIIAAMALEDLIGKIGYHVIGPVTSGEDALREVDNNRPDLVLMDIHIHGRIDGLTAAKKIVELKVPVIFMTGYFDQDLKKKALKISPIAYLVKPLDHNQLKSIITSVFE